MTAKTSVISNLAIAGVLFVLSLAIFTTDLTNVYVTVAAPVYSGDKNQKNVSLMFYMHNQSVDPGNNTYTEGITAVLNEKGVGATFFVTGMWAMQNPNLVKSLSDAGFELGNGGYSGRDLKKMSTAEQKKEISATHQLVRDLTGVDIKLFMPPMASFSKTTLKVAEGMGYVTVMYGRETTVVSSESVDVASGAQSITEKATQNLKNGDLVLLTPTEYTLNALPNIIDFYLSQGFSVLSVGANIK